MSMHEDLRLTEERFHLLVDAVTDYAIFMLDADGYVATWNSGAEKTKGYTSDEIVGQHFSIFYTPEDREAGKPGRLLETVRREGRVEDESWRVRKDGTRFWANVVMSALRDATGNVIGFAKVTRDLTERREVERRLFGVEQRFHQVVDAITDYAIFMLDPTGTVATWNSGAEKTKGYTAEEIVGKHFSVFYTPEDRVAGRPEQNLDAVRRTGRHEDESWRVRKDGTRFWANVVLTALRDEKGELIGYAKVTRDLTERKQREDAERHALREQVAREAAEAMATRAEEANRIKDEFLATVSHELRTPLSAIVGWSALLRQHDLAPDVAKAVDVIDRNARAQVKIIEDILDVSRIITGKLRIEPKPTDLGVVTKEAIEVVRPSADAKRIAITLEETDEAPLLVADAERIQQVVWNLLSNAVKFTDSGGAIHVAIRRESSRLLVSVRDTGRGIEESFLPYVFDRFKQADASTTRRVGGLGLGLALVRHIVELHGGSVSVESSGVGRGSTFTIALPVRAVAPRVGLPRREAAREAAVEMAHDALDGLRVLVVDDDADARELLETLLVQSGAVVATAKSADEGIVKLKEFRPEVLVSDIGMPDEDGISFVRRVRQLGPEEGGRIPSIALTAYTRSEDRTRALAAGFTTHIGKPVNPTDLVAAVANLSAFTRR
ncbi:MAG TPA: PAS domain S-box protein [Labilithrix sp.]